MEGIFDLLLVALAIYGLFAKSKKDKKKAQKSAAAPAQKTESTSEPAPSVSSRQVVSRLNIENAISAFSEMAEAIDAAKQTSSAAVPAQKKKPQTSIETESAMKKRADIVKARVLESLSGVSPTDEHGCIGGSMPDHTAEGESVIEHAAHEQNRRQKLAQEAAVSAKDLSRPTAADLRKAVVMSEILGKPVSLKGRRI